MARRVVNGQIGLFDAMMNIAERGTATRTSSVSARIAEPPSPEGKAFGYDDEARVLTLEALGGLEPFRSVVWIETRPWATQRVIEESEVCRFFLLFKAVFQTIDIPIGSDRKHYHFKYTYPNGRTYYHHRVDEFYGREWRVWDKCPTEAQRRETPWLNMS